MPDDPVEKDSPAPESPRQVEAFAEEVAESGLSMFPRAARLPRGPDSYLKLALLAFALVVLAALHFMPPEFFPAAPSSVPGSRPLLIDEAGRDAVAILVCAVILWVSEALPFPVTALLVFLAAPLLGVVKLHEAVAFGLGHPIVVFYIGVLLIAAAIIHSGLGTRLTYFILRHSGTGTSGILLSFLCVSAFMAMWTSTLGGVAMSTPLALGILQHMRLRPLESRFGRGLMIACAWGSLIGGVATPAGSGANPLVIGLLHDLAGIDISFLQWMAYGVPAMVVLLPVSWVVLLRAFPPEVRRLPVSIEQIEHGIRQLGPFSLREVYTCIVFILTVALWVLGPAIAGATRGRVSLSTHAVALLGGALLFVPKLAVFHWKDVQREIDWGGVLLIAGGLCLGRLLGHTGAADWLARLLLGKVAMLPPLCRVFAVILAVQALHLAFSSNNVTATIIIPLLVALAGDLRMDPWLLCGPAAFTCTHAFILVTESPVNVIPYSTGYFRIGDMAKPGVVMTLLAAACLTLVMLVVGALAGRPVV